MRKVFVLLLASLIVMLTIPSAYQLTTTDATYINITAEEAKKMMEDIINSSIVLLDVRPPAEYESGYIAGANSLPLSEMDCEACLHASFDNYKDKDIIVYCKSGVGSEAAYNILVSHGFENVYNMIGGLNAWKDAGFPIASGSNTNKVRCECHQNASKNLVISLSSDSFSSEIDKTLGSNKSVFLFFYADWCHFCQQQMPIIDELEKEYAEKITFIHVNGEEYPEAMKEFGASGYPSMFLIMDKGNDGKYESHYSRGFTDKETLKKSIDWIIANGSINENSKDNELGIGASPTLLIDDEKYTGRIFPLSNEFVNVSKDEQEEIRTQSYTSLCEYIGVKVKGTYTLNSKDVTTCEGLKNCYWDLQANVCRCEEWETLGPCNYDGCIGRCDGGCAGVLGSSIQRFTQECFNHDLCCRAVGGGFHCINPWDRDCGDEYRAAAHGWRSAPNCADDASVDVEHVSSGSGCDTEVPVKFKVKNTGKFYDKYNLAATCSPWSCDPPSSSVGPIAASSWEFVTVNVSVSEGDECTGSVKLTATSQCNPDVSDFADGSFTLCKCCPEGSPNEGTCYTPKPDEGCCEYDGECKDLTDEGVCIICYGGVWHSGWRCEDGECVPEASTPPPFLTFTIQEAGQTGTLTLTYYNKNGNKKTKSWKANSGDNKPDHEYDKDEGPIPHGTWIVNRKGWVAAHKDWYPIEWGGILECGRKEFFIHDRGKTTGCIAVKNYDDFTKKLEKCWPKGLDTINLEVSYPDTAYDCDPKPKCCDRGPNKDKKGYCPQKTEKGCCQCGDGKCYDNEGEKWSPDECRVCFEGNWTSGWWCDEKDKCVPEASTLVVIAVGLLFLAGYVRLLKRKIF